MADMNFLLHCVEWIRKLSDTQQLYVDIQVGDFKFVFENKDPVRKNRTPSQLKRDFTRRKDFKTSLEDYEQVNVTADGKNDVKDDTCLVNEAQNVETLSNQAVVVSEIQYDLKVEADVNVKNHDIVEAIEVNYDGALDDRDVSKDDPCRYIVVHKLEPELGHGVREKASDTKKNWRMYRVYVKNNVTASSVIEDWRHQSNFDDLAFGNAIRDKQQVRIKEVSRVK